MKKPFVPLVQLVLDQMFVAFGQGSGVIRIADDAIDHATEIYWDVIQANISVWEENPFRVREYARTLGHRAAHIALQNGRTIIEKKDVIQAIGRRQLVLMKRKLNSLAEADDSESDEGDCPFCSAD